MADTALTTREEIVKRAASDIDGGLFMTFSKAREERIAGIINRAIDQLLALKKPFDGHAEMVDLDDEPSITWYDRQGSAFSIIQDQESRTGWSLVVTDNQKLAYCGELSLHRGDYLIVKSEKNNGDETSQGNALPR